MRLPATIIFLLLSTAALAQEHRGCDAFAWPLNAEKIALAAATVETASGTELDRNSSTAVKIALKPIAEAALPMPPERAPKLMNSYAGSISFAAASTNDRYRVSLPEGAWIDVVQDGAYLKPIAFTGALDCPGIRKSVEFEIGSGPFTLQLSDVASPSIAVVLTPPD